MRQGDRVTLTNAPGQWRILQIERHIIWLTGIDEFAKTLASLSPYGTVGVSRQDVAIPKNVQEQLI